MAEPVATMDDLEDGEIESDGEENVEADNTENKEEQNKEDTEMKKEEFENNYYSKSGKKKKSKSNKEHKSKEKGKKNRNRKHADITEEDFAGHIEKAIKKALSKNNLGDEHAGDDGNEERRKHKKRKKNENKDGPHKKRKKQEYKDEMDESEMMCVRGASPVQRQSPDEMYAEDDNDSYASDTSNEEQHQRQQRHRPQQRDRNKSNKNDRRRVGGAHPMQDPDGVCLYYMQGKCHKGDDCVFSHNAHPPRKMELCKFYLMDCCAKRDKCLYMHADFPCKYYHTGIPCIYKDECKFAHGKPLTDNLKNILLKHIESAPKEILGDFPRLNREGAMKMIQTTQSKLIKQFSERENHEKNIPSLFELNIPIPQVTEVQMHQYNNDRQNKISPKSRQSRWQNDNPNHNSINNMPSVGHQNISNVLSIRNLTGVLTPKQISDFPKMGIDSLDQLGQLTVLQLNSIGISLKQISELQLNTINVQKFGLINSNAEQTSPEFLSSAACNKDLDLRVPPAMAHPSSVSVSTELPGKDIDMRFCTAPTLPVGEDKLNSKTSVNENQSNKDMIDIDQYTKDALKFALKDKENIDISNETFESEIPVASNQPKDVDHRVLPFAGNSSTITNTNINSNNSVLKKECDTDIRFLQPEPIFKGPGKRNRRSTTDDEDNNLLIDEKWYSSDEEKGIKKKSPASSPRDDLSPQVPAPHVIEPSTVLSRIGDLSKIDISEEVTKLLNTMKNNLHENKPESNLESSESIKSRDPRSRKSPEKVISSPKVVTKKPRVSIYDCIEGEPTDGRRRSDVDLRKPDLPFGDTDLRQGSSGDIDLRLGLPFKAIPNYTPASEINGSINSHPPIPYKLAPIYIPRPDYTDIRNSTAKSQALSDPRLRKVFRLSLEDSNSDSEKLNKATAAPSATGPRVDPRRKQKEEISNQEQKLPLLDIQTILQSSDWFKELSSTQKIFVNQHLMPVTQLVKQFHQEKVPGKMFDLGAIQSNSVLCSIFTNLGITITENGEYAFLQKPKEALLKTPVNLNQPPNPFGMNNITSGVMDPGMNMLPMGIGSGQGMNNMNVGPMHGFNQPMPDPRGAPPTPGLLGIAPNVPHNFGNNFGPNNFGNIRFNGPNPGNEFNYMDAEQNFQRFPNRGGNRGRGGDRWNRGGSGRGQRDRKNYNERSNWKGERH